MSDTTPNPTPEVAPVSTPTVAETSVTPAAPAVSVPNFRETGSTTATDLRRELSDVLKFVEGGDSKVVTITRHGKVVAAVIGGTEFKLLARLQASVKTLAPKLGLTEAQLFEKLAAFEPPVAVMATDDQKFAVLAALKEIPAPAVGASTATVVSDGSVFPQEPKAPVVNAEPVASVDAPTGAAFES